jgi:hypothetical protein
MVRSWPALSPRLSARERVELENVCDQERIARPTRRSDDVAMTIVGIPHLEHLSNELYARVPEDDRRRFLYGQIPPSVSDTARNLGLIAFFR